ncbi:putative MFS family arabinose efflux permease [Diaminobutyricimonas aerilata]|uniref:Multidrug efflux pump Tap n=1 Tax=Diaminobutyricimonas aerilata TaxID=1162967 RepID=A0A2M9CKA6_9MICO|nr:MFS transporter [Diaminobutyricimonas aerilata]PJJ72314.1 putative MFS family arabinose efflux permease [Diaminobutyricimonas aerilata]
MTAPRRVVPLVALLSADTLSTTANAVTAIAVPLYAWQVTGSPLAVGLAGAVTTVPLILGGAFGGTLVDRIGRRTVGVVSDAASGLTVLAIPVLAALDQLPFAVFLALVFGGAILDLPGSTARSTQLPELAADAGLALPRALGLHAALHRTSSLVGAALAGLLLALGGPTTPLFASAACFAVSVLIVLLLVPRTRAVHPTDPADGEETGPATGAGYWRSLADGLRFAARHPLIRALIVLIVVTNAIDAAGMTVLKPLYAAGQNDDGALLGLLVAFFAGGALTGAALYGAVGHRLPRRATFVVCFVLAGAPPYAAMALDLPVPVVLTVVLLSGLAAGPLNPLIDTVLFALVPERMRGRVFGATGAAVSAAMPVGALVAGVATDAVGLTMCLAVAAAVYALVTIGSAVGGRWRALDEEPQPALTR